MTKIDRELDEQEASELKSLGCVFCNARGAADAR